MKNYLWSIWNCLATTSSTSVNSKTFLLAALMLMPMFMQKLTAATKAEIATWLDAQDGILPGETDSLQYTWVGTRTLTLGDRNQNDWQTVKMYVNWQEVLFDNSLFVWQNAWVRVEWLAWWTDDFSVSGVGDGQIEWWVPLALWFVWGDVNQTREYSDQFRVYFEAENLVNTWKIHVRASNRIFRPWVDDPKTFWQTLYTIDGPAWGNAPKFMFNSVVNLDMQALQAADHDWSDREQVNDWTVYITYVEQETGDSWVFNAYPQLDVLNFAYDFSPPKISPNPVAQSEGIRYEVPSAFQDGCTIELINNSGQTMRTWIHEKWWTGIFPIYNHVKWGVYYVIFTSPTGKQETIKVVILW